MNPMLVIVNIEKRDNCKRKAALPPAPPLANRRIPLCRTAPTPSLPLENPALGRGPVRPFGSPSNVDYSQWCVLRAFDIALRMDIGALVGKNIVRIRNERNVTQEELAFRAEIDRSYLSQIESGKRNPSLKLLARIADSLDVKVAQFLMDGD
jgi:DNA-binding XRE family transcriptional regulator